MGVLGRVGLVALVSHFGMACGGAAGSIPVAEVRDSAGVTIVENALPTDAQMVGWSIAPEPRLSIGVVEGDDQYQFFRVQDGFVEPDGRIVVANAGSSEIRVFDGSGDWLASWGGEGEGPGEFTGLSSVASWAGDSVLAWDTRQRRGTIYDRNGELGRTVTLQADDRVARSDFVDVIGDHQMLARGTFIITDDGLESGMSRSSRPYLIASAIGEIASHLGDHLGPETFMMINPQMVMVTRHPFARETHEAVWGDLILLSPSDRYELQAFDDTGALVRSVRVDHELETQTDEELNAFIEARIADADEARRPQMRQQYEGMPVVESLPAFDEVIVDATSHLWVREFLPPPADSPRWIIFNPEGHALGWVEVPNGTRVLEIGPDYILAVMTDDFDVERVQLWDLDRETGTSAP